MQLKDKKIIVTGGTSGMAAAAAKRFVEEGAKVVSLDLGLPDEENRIHGVNYLVGTVTDKLELEKLYAEAVEWLGGLDTLFNIAGVNRFKPTLDLTSEDIDLLFDVNVKGLIFSCQAAYPYLKENGGSIINFGSQASFNPGPDSSHYAAAKAAVLAFTYKIAWEWGKDGIRCNTIWPAAWTPLFEKTVLQGAPVTPELKSQIQDGMKNAFPLGYLGDPYDDIAPALVFLASDQSRYITGQCLPINGGSASVF
ncbi:SDR family NAD(P)-dependent oxidoreductase [Streptococcus pluranimalium]|uniref:SDR family NAD(P)-dependent oxidoreductase n=1 Tax=Streptococcus pluranimalium TaxID=82348 RepID=UPI0039FBD2E4